MNGFALIFLAILVVAQLVVPRKWAMLPLIIGGCYFSKTLRIDIGAFSFTTIRILILVVLAKSVVSNNRIAGRLNGIDKTVLAWVAWMLVSSVFTKDPGASIIYRLGVLADTGGIYWAVRIFCSTKKETLHAIKIIAIVLIPISIEMVAEIKTGSNQFSILGAHANVLYRDGFRASGPFRHAILAGTVGGTCLPLMLALWQNNKKTAIMGCFACVVMVIASNSSGPIMSLAFSGASLFLWKYRSIVPQLRYFAVFLYFFLLIAMNRPPYYIISMIDLTGSSTGYFRARLIESSIEHLNEWWFAGTEYTRHWMATGVSHSPDHTDITNHYLVQGVLGGLPLMLLYMASIAIGFRLITKSAKISKNTGEIFILWALGSSLFSHTATQVSISYFDQSVMFIFFTLATISSITSARTEDDFSNKSSQGQALSLRSTDAPCQRGI